MTTFHRGDIVLVPFEFTDGSGTKMRPAVIVSTEEYHQTCPDVLLAAITGNLNALPHAGDHLVKDWKSAGLLKPSLAQTKIATIESVKLGKKLGSMSIRDLEGLARAYG